MYVIGILLSLAIVLMTCVLSGNATRIFLIVLVSLIISAVLIYPRYRPYLELVWYIVGFGCFVYLLIHRYIPGIRQIGTRR
jgi:hypothetical protein